MRYIHYEIYIIIYLHIYIYIPLHLKCSTSIFGFRLRKSFLITGFFPSATRSSDITLFSCKWDSRATSQFLVPATAFSFWWQPCKPQQRYSYHCNTIPWSAHTHASLYWCTLPESFLCSDATAWNMRQNVRPSFLGELLMNLNLGHSLCEIGRR